MDKFTIRAHQFSWITGEADDPEDLCLHGTPKPFRRCWM